MMIFLSGLLIGWITGIVTVIIYVLCINSGRNREQSDQEQMEYLKREKQKNCKDK